MNNNQLTKPFWFANVWNFFPEFTVEDLEINYLRWSAYRKSFANMLQPVQLDRMLDASCLEMLPTDLTGIVISFHYGPYRLIPRYLLVAGYKISVLASPNIIQKEQKETAHLLQFNNLEAACLSYIDADYTYSWLPLHGISFAGKLTDYYLMQFHNRIMVGNLLALGTALIVHVVFIDCSYWLRFQLLTMELNAGRLAGRLSKHFVKEWIKIVQHNKLLYRNDTLELFRYIIAVTANRKVKVAIAEEWKQLKVMASCFTDRLMLFKGEEVLFATDWSRSIIAASMLSWFENALNYSPPGAQGQIIMEWTRVDGQLHFQMINYVSGKRSEGIQGWAISCCRNYSMRYCPEHIGLNIANKIPFSASSLHCSKTTGKRFN